MEIEVFRKQLQQAITKFPDKLAVNVGDAMQESQGKFQATFQRKRLNHPKSGPVQPPGGGLRRVTGSLSMSFDGLVERGNLEDVETRLYSAGVRYASVHEFGSPKLGIPPRLGFFDTWEAHIESDLMPRLRKAVAKTIAEGLGNG